MIVADLRRLRSRTQLMAWIDRLELNYERGDNKDKEDQRIEAEGKVPIDYEDYLALKVLLGLDDLLFVNILENIIVSKQNNIDGITLKDFIPILMNDERYHDAVEHTYNEMLKSNDISQIVFTQETKPDSDADMRARLNTKEYQVDAEAGVIKNRLWEEIQSLRGASFSGDSEDGSVVNKDGMFVYPRETIVQSTMVDLQDVMSDMDKKYCEYTGITPIMLQKLKSMAYHDDILASNRLLPPVIDTTTKIPKMRANDMYPEEWNPDISVEVYNLFFTLTNPNVDRLAGDKKITPHIIVYYRDYNSGKSEEMKTQPRYGIITLPTDKRVNYYFDPYKYCVYEDWVDGDMHYFDRKVKGVFICQCYAPEYKEFISNPIIIPIEHNVYTEIAPNRAVERIKYTVGKAIYTGSVIHNM